MKFAAIDIGSNAVRLLLTRIIENGDAPLFKKESLVRIPLRLGDDVFLKSVIPPDKVRHLMEAIAGFRHLITAYGALDYLACATSAMREASNGREIAEQVRAETGIELEIIDGRREAEVICQNRPVGQLVQADDAAGQMFIDVGGGSTEMTLFRAGEVIDSRSFSIGTIRLLKGLVAASEWKGMKVWLKSISEEHAPQSFIGSGGNINKIFRLSRQKDGKPMTYRILKEIRDYLAEFTLEERIREVSLRPDRADVIVPAADIFLKAMKWSKVKRIYVPQIGLADGLVHLLYDRALRVAGTDLKIAK